MEAGQREWHGDADFRTGSLSGVRSSAERKDMRKMIEGADVAFEIYGVPWLSVLSSDART